MRARIAQRSAKTGQVEDSKSQGVIGRPRETNDYEILPGGLVKIVLTKGYSTLISVEDLP
jgi:hypothetical protein